MNEGRLGGDVLEVCYKSLNNNNNQPSVQNIQVFSSSIIFCENPESVKHIK